MLVLRRLFGWAVTCAGCEVCVRWPDIACMRVGDGKGAPL